MKTKKEALAAYLGRDIEDIKQGFDAFTLEVGTQKYLVLFDAEATILCRAEIRDLLWAFNPAFIREHSKVKLDIADIAIIQERRCEDANPFVKVLIDDMDKFLNDAIASDGRGHFLAHYDGEENEQEGYFIYRIN